MIQEHLIIPFFLCFHLLPLVVAAGSDYSPLLYGSTLLRASTCSASTSVGSRLCSISLNIITSSLAQCCQLNANIHPSVLKTANIIMLANLLMLSCYYPHWAQHASSC